MRLLSWTAGAALCLVAWWFGGWPWALLWALAFLLAARQEGHPATALATAGPAFFWLALFHWTGDRRLFFPFAMQVGQASSPILLAAAFFAIRIQQSATAHVLAVEFLVAAVVLIAGHAIQRFGALGPQTRSMAAAAASLLALLGLLL